MMLKETLGTLKLIKTLNVCKNPCKSQVELKEDTATAILMTVVVEVLIDGAK